MKSGQILVVSQNGLNHLYPFIEGSEASAHKLASEKSALTGKGYVVIRIEEVIDSQSRERRTPDAPDGTGLPLPIANTGDKASTDK